MSSAGAAPGEWADRYQQYLDQSAQNAARIRALYREIINCIASGELSSDVLDNRLPFFLQSAGPAYARDLATVSMRFLTGLVESGTDYSYDLVERVAPGAVDRPFIRPPQLEPHDWATWMGRLTEFAAKHSAAHIEMMRSVMDRVAAGDIVAADAQIASRDFNDEHLPESVQQTVRLYFDLLCGLDQVTSDLAVEYLMMVLGDEPDERFVLSVRGVIGGVATVRIAVTNTHSAPTSVRCVLTDLRRADGLGPAFEPEATITPERFPLQPGEERTVALSITLRPGVFFADVRYVGMLHVLAPGETLLVADVDVYAGPATHDPEPLELLDPFRS